MKKLFNIFLFFVSLMGACKDAHVLDIRGVDLPIDKPIYCGSNSDIMISGLPDSSVVFRFNPLDSSYNWWMKHPCYMVLNEKTQNVIRLDQVNAFIYKSTRIPLAGYTEALTAFKTAKAGNKYAYLKIGNLLLARKGMFNADQLDSLNSLVTMQKDSALKIVLLDSGLRIEVKSGKTIAMQVEGTLPTGGHLKIGFFQIFNSKIFSASHEHAFHVGDTIYNTTVKAMYTPFGADQIFLDASGNIQVSFNHFYRAVLPVEQVQAALVKNHLVPVSIQQKRYANTYDNDIYINNLAGVGDNDWLTIDRSFRLHLIPDNWLREENFRESRLNIQTIIWAVLPLIAVYLFGLFVIQRLTEKDLHENASNQRESKRWRRYFHLLYLGLFLLGCGRLLIGYNLSFTAPYFPLTFPSAIIIAPLTMLCVLYLWLIFVVSSGIEAVRLNLRFIMFAFTFILLGGLAYVISAQFSLFWEGLKAVSWLQYKQAESNYQNIGVLLAFVLALTFIPLLCGHYRSAQRPKNWLNAVLFGATLLFLTQHNSYSVSVLLIIIFLLSLLSTPARSPFGLISEEAGEMSPQVRRKLIWQKPFFLLGCLFSLIMAFGIAFLKRDPGYLINLVLFPLLVIFLLVAYHRYYSPDIHVDRRKARFNQEICISFIGSIVLYVCFLLICGSLSRNYDPLEKGRFGSRFTAFYNFETIEDYGTRESEKQAQFFSELAKYTYPQSHSNYEPVHPGISSFTDPVVKNDLSAPFGLIYQAGPLWYMPVVGLLVMWALLLYVVLRMCFAPGGSNQQKTPHFNQYGLIRLYCVSALVGSGLWLVFSYYNILPFTGRLIYGFGQDSAAEVLETILLFGYMGLVGKTMK